MAGLPWSGRRWWARLNAPLLASGLAGLVCALLYALHLARWLPFPGLDAWEASTEDARVRLAGTRAPVDDRIVIVALDDRSRSLAPELFQTRRELARLLEAIAVARPRVVGLDLFFAQPEFRLDRRVVDQVDQARALLVAEGSLSPAGSAARDALSAVLEELRGDDVLAEAVSHASLFLGFLLHLDESSPGGPVPPGLSRGRLGEAVVVAQPPGRRPARAGAVTISMASIAEAAAGAGFVNVAPDDDGAVRRVPLVLEYSGAYYGALGLSLAVAGGGPGGPGPSSPRQAGEPIAVSYVTGDEFLEMGSTRVPVDRRGLASLSYLGPAGTFPHVSAVDVLRGAVAPSVLADRIVIVGYTDAARDTIVQPFDRVFPGVEGHATLIHNLLHGELLRQTGPGVDLLLLLALAGFIALLQIRRVRLRGPWVVGVGTLAGVAAYFAVSQLLFSAEGILVPVVAPILGAVVAAAAGLSTALATEGREKARLRSAFSRYVPPGVVERILADPSRIRLGGERRELTVLFSDIRGFSRSAENLEPEVLSEYMNEFLTPMTQLVLAEDGMLDKYIGDALMAVYGAPLELTDHAPRSCRTALAMLTAIGPLNQEFSRRGLPPVQIGIGINSGPMSVGNMGSQARFDYTVLGDAVNLGARLEALTRDYRVDVLVGETTARLAAGEFAFRELDTVRVKGRAGVGRIHELCGTIGDCRFSREELAVFAGGLADYRAARWSPAEEQLRWFLSRHPADGPAQVLVERIGPLRARPPGAAWDGVFDQLVK